ncbi:MAG: PP2C family serine/threonine-protein phosphatase [Terracidiphilus sp.]
MTHMGKIRTNNEDSVSFVRPTDNDALQTHGLLALLADGMGGHEGGELASKLAVDEITRTYYDSNEPPPVALASAFRNANRVIFRAARANRKLKGMGTTCIAVALCNDRAWWAWIGDSRLYLLRGGQIYRMSEDHTVVQDMMRRGLLTREEAHNHRDRGVLERALGTRETAEFELGSDAIQLALGDRLLLCSDGLHDLVDDDEIARCGTDGPVNQGAERLLDLALELGGHDNITVVLLEANPASSQPKRPLARTREQVIA